MPSVQNESNDADLNKRILREGWTLHQRLQVAAERVDTLVEASGVRSLESWCQMVAPDNPANFNKRLSWDGLTPACAAWAFDPPDQSIPQDPEWLPLLEALRQASRDASAGSLHQQLAERGGQQPFVHVWRPAAAWALQRLQQCCSEIEPQLLLANSAWLDLGEGLLERLCNATDQAIWELFYQRRTPGQMLLAHLGANGDGTGEPIHEAYDNFVAEMLSGGYGLLLAEFPVLGRILAMVTDLWLTGSEEMLRRLASSRSGLQVHFSIPIQAPLQKIQQGLSDPHRGGRAVAILTFAAGDDPRKVVYKPKDMRVDATYQCYLKQLNDDSSLEPLRCLRVLPCDGYGFMEWVEHRPCNTDNALVRFYRNAGRTMAVLHLLGCTDCHYENLIASDEQLVLIDTETLLEADLRDLVSDERNADDDISDLQTSMQGSVLRSGLLPQWLMAGAGRKRAFDISALGIQPPPPERKMTGWLGLNTDGMMAGSSNQACELPSSLPVGLGSPQRLTDFVDELCAGFVAQLQEAIRLRRLLLVALDNFNRQPRRLVARATRIYFAIQRQMLEPASLRNAVDHGLKVEQLSRSFLLASDKPTNWPMFAAEVLQIERFDIPFFEHLIDGEDLPLPEGLPPITQFMKSNGLTAARRRLRELEQSEIDFQEQLIRGAIAARHLIAGVTSSARGTVACSNDLAATTSLLSADDVRLEAFRLGDELWNDAIRDRKGRPEWLGMDLGADGESFHFGLIGNSLYSGGSGIAVLFARLALDAETSGDFSTASRWRDRAWSCFEGLAALAGRNSNDQVFRIMRDLPFGISGSGGTLLALQLLSKAGLSDAGALAQLLIDQVRPERLLADEGIDVIGGITGLIGPLLSADGRGQQLALVCGERLLELQQANGGWSIGDTAANQRKPPLTGFSHGAAGMAAALAMLGQASGDTRMTTAAQRAVAYERSVFVVNQGNWPDFRISTEPNEFMLSWCHGAPGILLSRHLLRACGMADAQTSEELQFARTTTLASLEAIQSRNNEGWAAHLCCGVLGLTSLLRLDALCRATPVQPVVTTLESCIINKARSSGGYTFYTVDTGSINLPGLFTGKAGVALALLESVAGQRWMPALLSAGLLVELPG